MVTSSQDGTRNIGGDPSSKDGQNPSEATEQFGNPSVELSVQSQADVAPSKTAQAARRNNRKSRKRQAKASGSPSSPEEFRGNEQAKALGLYVLFDGPPDRRVWHFYSLESGFDLGWWSPPTGRYHLHGKDGSCRDRWAVVRIAAGRSITWRKESQ